MDGKAEREGGRDSKKKHCIIDVYGHDANEMNVFPLESTSHINPFLNLHLANGNKKAPVS